MATANVQAYDHHWQFNKSLLERNMYMFENKMASDVTFIVGDSQGDRIKGKLITAHKYILISASPVFMSMLCGEMREQGEITVPDVDPDAFTEMLRYLYTDNVEISGDSVMYILYASKKYLIPGLTKRCTDYLEKELNAENACVILEQCILFDEGELISRCMETIEEQTDKVLKSDGFKKISQKTLCRILDSDELSVDEVDILRAYVEWAKAQIESEASDQKKYAIGLDGVTLRKKLGDALFKIRFTEMTQKEFGDMAIPLDILSNNEELMCCRYFIQTKKPSNLPFHVGSRNPDLKSCLCLPMKTPDRTTRIITNELIFRVTNSSKVPVVVDGFQGSSDTFPTRISHIKARPQFRCFIAGIGSNILTNIQQLHDGSKKLVKVLQIKEQIMNPNKSLEFKIQFNSLQECSVVDSREASFTHRQITISASSCGNGIPVTGIFAKPHKL